MINIDIFPKYMYKDKKKYERIAVHIPESESWEISYFRTDFPEESVIYKWDGNKNSANNIINTMCNNGFKKTKYL